MMSAIPMTTVKDNSNRRTDVSNVVATILGAADVNNDRGYYQYCDGPKYTCGYNDLPSHCYCAFL
jgi:hypothetical protein